MLSKYGNTKYSLFTYGGISATVTNSIRIVWELFSKIGLWNPRNKPTALEEDWERREVEE